MANWNVVRGVIRDEIRDSFNQFGASGDRLLMSIEVEDISLLHRIT